MEEKLISVSAMVKAIVRALEQLGVNGKVCTDIVERTANRVAQEVNLKCKLAFQLDLFVRFIKGNKWDVFLRNKDWGSFARRYNGPGYAQNKYDKKLAAAYEKYKGEIRKS